MVLLRRGKILSSQVGISLFDIFQKFYGLRRMELDLVVVQGDII